MGDRCRAGTRIAAPLILRGVGRDVRPSSLPYPFSLKWSQLGMNPTIGSSTASSIFHNCDIIYYDTSMDQSGHYQGSHSALVFVDTCSSEAMNPYLPEFKVLHDLAERRLVAASVN